MQLNHFFFDVEIWGTVSDWIMLLITLVTAYFLYKTLESQKEVQKIQIDLYKIENIRFKESIKPLLNFSIKKGKTKMENRSFFLLEIKNDSEGIALEFKIHFPETKNLKLHDYKIEKSHLKKGDEPFTVYYYILDNLLFLNEITVEAEYEDISGTKYKQVINYDINTIEPSVVPSLPILAE